MTAGRLILDMPNPALDRNGDPYSGAKLYFYQNGTTVNQSAYTDPTLTVAHPNPLISDSAGRFPELWGDVAASYTVNWTDATGALIYKFDNVVPLAVAVAADGSGINVAAFQNALGLGSAAYEAAGAVGHRLAFLDGDDTFSGAVNFTGGLQLGGLDVGYRDMPSVTHDANFTLTILAAGKRLLHTSATAHAWTIPLAADVAFNDGAAIGLRNIGTGAVTVTRASGVVLRKAGAGTDADVAMASFGLATLIKDTGDQWCIVGSGLT